jgi:hypothetical protein
MTPATYQRIYTTLLASLVWLSLGLQFYLTTTRAIANGSGWWIGVTRYLGYFTILTNILVGLVLTIPLLRPGSRWGRFFARPEVRTATAAYILIVGAAYSLLLRNLWQPVGWQLVADRMLHDVIPIAYLLFWVAFVPKTTLRWQHLLLWLVYPLVYLVLALIRGGLSSWYPYPFLNAAKLGYPFVFLNSAALFASFCIVGSVLIGIGKFLHQRRRR